MASYRWPAASSCLLTLCAVLGLSCLSSATAQQRVTGIGGLSFVLGIPMNDFSENVDNVGLGGNGFVGLRLSNSPIVMGIDLTFLIYGRSRDRVPFSQTVGPRVMVDVVTHNNIIQPHLFLRLQQSTGTLRPYADVLGGFKYLFTETRIKDADFGDDREIASTTNFDDLAFSGGAGAGLEIRVARWLNDESGRPGALFVKVGAQYVLGQEAEYLREGALRDDNNNGSLDRSELNIGRSRTDLFVPQIGMTLTF